MSVTPPLAGIRPAGDQTCGRLIANGHCGRPAMAHIMWTTDTENGHVCAEHVIETEHAWVYYDRHPVGTWCTMPGSVWIYSWDEPPGNCAFPVDDETAALIHASASLQEETRRG